MAEWLMAAVLKTAVPHGFGGINQMQVCDGLAPAQSCIPLFLYKCVSLAARANGAEGVRESAPDLLRCSLTAKGGNRGCWSGCLGEDSAGDQTDRRASAAFLLTSAPVGRWIRAPSAMTSSSARI